MKKIEKKDTLSIVLDFIVLMVGCYGIFNGLIISLVFPENTVFSLILLGIVAIVFYIRLMEKKMIYKYVGMIEIILLIILVILFNSSLFQMFENLMKVIQKDYFLEFSKLITQKSSNQTLFFILVFTMIGVPLVAMISSIVMKGKKILIKLFLMLLIMIFPLLIKHSIDSLSCYCVILFIIYEYVFGYSLSYQRNNFITKIVLACSIVLMMFFGHFFLESNPVFDAKTSDVLSNIANWIDDSRLKNTSGGLTTGVSSGVDGKLPTGNIELNDSVAMKVTSSLPMTTYLRGYSLAHYSENNWKPVYKPYESENSMSYLPTYLYRKYPGRQLEDVMIETVKRTSYQFVPYYSMMSEDLVDDSYYKPDVSSKLRVIYDSISFNYFDSEYDNSHSQYSDYAKKEYLEISDDLKSKLLSFIKDNFETEFFILEDEHISLESKMNAIKDILRVSTDYDLNTGELPAGEDFVEYFLFKNKKGSCTHYATTATLMLRCFEIPARFTSGFVMQEEDFEGGVASIKNNRAHAWTEVYIAGYGWVPYEVTPTTDNGDFNIESVGSMLDGQLSQQQRDQEPEVPNEPNEVPETPIQDKKDIEQESKTPQYDVLLQYQDAIWKSCIGILCFVVYRIVSSQYFFMIQKRKSANRQIISYYLRMKKISRFGLSIDSKIRNYVLEAQFSQHTLDDELTEIKTYYQTYRLETYRSLSWYKKIVYKFIYGYI